MIEWQGVLTIFLYVHIVELMTISSRFLVAALAVSIAVPLAAQAPPLTLAEAVRRADSTAFPNRFARASRIAAEARAAGADQGVLPGVRSEVGAVRTSDPLGAFGFLLRQRAVTPAAFDPAGLNQPSPRTDVGAAIIGEVPLLNADAWAGRRAAKRMADAATHQEDWVGGGVDLQVVQQYFGAVLAMEQQLVLRAGEAAGAAHVRRAETALRNGTVTRSDLLLAQVRLGELETRRMSAEADARLARLQLALVLGTPGDTMAVLPRVIPTLHTTTLPTEGSIRADVAAAVSSRDAAEAEAQRRAFALLPRVNGFGRYEWHDATTPFAGRAMWTVGVMASWSPFSGGAELAARREARANAEAARAGVEATEASAALELAAAESHLAVAQRALEIAARSVEQSAEAHRIVERKYEGGLATVAELLEAQATELGARLGEANARYDVIVAACTLARAGGADLAPLIAALDASALNPESL